MKSIDDFIYPNRKKVPTAHRRPLSEQQDKVYNLARNGWKPKQIAKRLGMSLPNVHDSIKKIKHNGWMIDE